MTQWSSLMGKRSHVVRERHRRVKPKGLGSFMEDWRSGHGLSLDAEVRGVFWKIIALRAYPQGIPGPSRTYSIYGPYSGQRCSSIWGPSVGQATTHNPRGEEKEEERVVREAKRRREESLSVFLSICILYLYLYFSYLFVFV